MSTSVSVLRSDGRFNHSWTINGSRSARFVILNPAHVDALDGRVPTSRGMRTSDLIKCYVGLLCLGQSDFEAITNHRADPAFRRLLKAAKVPSSEWLRQRLEKLAGRGLSEHLAGRSVELLKAVQASISQESGAAAGHVCLDLERLPSGKFAVNDRVLRLAMLAYNCLRRLDQ